MPHKIVIGIESSCDETSVAIVESGKKVLSSLVASQIELHRVYGGIVPEIACRKHIEVINPLINEAFVRAGISPKEINAVSVTNRPGLVGALLVGAACAKAMSYTLGIPLIGVNHLEGHIYANFLHFGEIPFPFLCLLVSGGHTSIILGHDHCNFEYIGQTRDDAAGEAFDKVARLLGLCYPGGPEIDRLAKDGNPNAIKFPRAFLEEGSFDFSFSGLKTSVINFIKGKEAGKFSINDICASFQEACVDILIKKLIMASKKHGITSLCLAGGVACNSRLRKSLSEASINNNCSLFLPPPDLCTDNAAMIATCGYYMLERGMVNSLDMDVFPNV